MKLILSGNQFRDRKTLYMSNIFHPEKCSWIAYILLDQKNKSENSHFLLFVTLAAPSEYVSATVKTGPAAKVRAATSTPATS